MHCTLNFPYTQDMITLHKVTSKIKKILKWGMILVVLVIVFLILFRLGINMKERFFPTPLPPPTVSFGKLPNIQFASSADLEIPAENLTYSLNTVSGTLPVFPDRIFVNRIIQPNPNILAPKTAGERVSQIGFTLAGVPLSESIYRWVDQAPPFRTFVADIFSFNFNLSSRYFSDPLVLSGNNLSNEQAAVNKANSFLTSLSSLPSDLDEAKTKTVLLSIKNGKLVSATSLSTAQIIRVDFFQRDINNLPIFYPKPPFSAMNVFVSGGKYESQIVQANFFHQNVSQAFATYPIKSASEAFSEVKKGEAYIASYYGDNKQVAIRTVFLGYYLGENPQDYLMPIIIFQGDNGFYAYVWAVRDEWLSK